MIQRLRLVYRCALVSLRLWRGVKQRHEGEWQPDSVEAQQLLAVHNSGKILSDALSTCKVRILEFCTVKDINSNASQQSSSLLYQQAS